MISRRKRTALIAVGTVSCLALLTVLTIQLYPSTRQEKLAWRLGRFQEVVAKYTRLQEQGALGTGPVFEDGGYVRVEPGPPLRIAFRIEGIADYWSAWVYDPSGEVAKVGDLRREADAAGVRFDNWAAAQADPRGVGDLIMLFGGAMHSCEHVQDDWYWCAFN